jgi:hypothetical protein
MLAMSATSTVPSLLMSPMILTTLSPDISISAVAVSESSKPVFVAWTSTVYSNILNIDNQ